MINLGTLFAGVTFEKMTDLDREVFAAAGDEAVIGSSGRLLIIVDEAGIHIVDSDSGDEVLFIVEEVE
jgi:hypothetical protein